MRKNLNRFLALIIGLLLMVPALAFGNGGESERLLPRFVDDAGLLTVEEADGLEAKLDEISERQRMDVVIITINSLEGLGVVEYADYIYENYGYGFGEGHDGILLLLAMEEREWAISTEGAGIPTFTDKGQEYMTDSFIPYLSKGDFAKGFNVFADLSDDFINQAKAGQPYDINNMPEKKLSPMWILYSLLGGSGIGFLGTMSMKSNLKSVAQQRVAANYLVSDSLGISKSRDQYLYNVVTRQAIPKEKSSGGGGGSTTHTSSSGRTHGGSSGKF